MAPQRIHEALSPLRSTYSDPAAVAVDVWTVDGGGLSICAYGRWPVHARRVVWVRATCVCAIDGVSLFGRVDVPVCVCPRLGCAELQYVLVYH